MTKKRRSRKAKNYEHANEDSAHGTEQENNAKRVKLTLSSDTTLQDLPVEILESILVKAIVMEVSSYVQTTWSEKFETSLNRLKSVSLTWSGVLSSQFVRDLVHEILAGTGKQTAILEMVINVPMSVIVYDMTSVKDEMFMLCRPNGEDYVVNVYDRNNMAEVKDVIPLPGLQQPWGIAGCSVSNCVYVLNEGGDSCVVYRITKGDDRKYTMHIWIRDLELQLPAMYVATNGKVILLSRPCQPERHLILVYCPFGLLLDNLYLNEDVLKFRFISALLPKSDDGFIVVLINGNCLTELVHLDARGDVLRRHVSALDGETNATYADCCGRIMLVDGKRNMELLDRDFNCLALERDRADVRVLKAVGFPSVKHFNEQRGEICSVPFSYFAADDNRRICMYRISDRYI